MAERRMPTHQRGRSQSFDKNRPMGSWGRMIKGATHLITPEKKVKPPRWSGGRDILEQPVSQGTKHGNPHPGPATDENRPAR